MAVALQLCLAEIELKDSAARQMLDIYFHIAIFKKIKLQVRPVLILLLHHYSRYGVGWFIVEAERKFLR